MRTAGTRGDPLARHRALPGVARPPGLDRASSSSAARRRSTRRRYFENGLVDRIYHFGGLTSFVNPRLLDQIDLYPGQLLGPLRPEDGRHHRRRHPRPEDRRVSRHGRRQHDRRVVPGRRARSASAAAFALAAKRSYIDVWFNNVVPQDFVGVTAAPGLLGLPGDLHLQAGERRSAAGDGPRLGRRRLRLNLKQPADGDPTIARQHRPALAVLPRCRPSWQRNLGAPSSRTSRPASACSTTTRDRRRLRRQDHGLDAFLRAEWRAKVSESVKLIGGFDGLGFNVDVIYDGPVAQSTEGNPGYNAGPLGALPNVALRRRVPDHPPCRLHRGAGPGRRAPDAGARRPRTTTTATSRRGRSTRASPPASRWRERRP